jgi:predicted ATPase
MREAIELMEQEMQRLTEPQAQIVHIWVLLSIADGYEKTFRKAIEAAVVRNARSEELSSTLYLAPLLMKHGRGDEARSMLAEIYGWFTEGFDTADLIEAKALLEELNR